ncbi:MAG: cytochrome c [Planctomycetota bacterium]
MKTPVSWRIALMIGLVAAFAGQTYLVYSDSTGYENDPLTEEALAGREIWLSRNCQSCHQLYGFGGFLGPDLTNAGPRLEQQRLKELLTVGSKQMPAFDLTDTEIAQVYAFLSEVDKTGIGQASKPTGELSDDEFKAFVDAAELSADVKAGGEVFLQMCTACHKPLNENLVGNTIVPDPTMISTRMKKPELLKILNAGRPEKGMPAFGISGQKADNIAVFLDWLAANREALESAGGDDEDAGVDWFEYRK